MTPLQKFCERCDGKGWSHRESCMGRHTTEDERATIGHCMEFCGSDECAKDCDCGARQP